MLRPKVALALASVQIIFGIHYFVAKLILQMVPARAWAAMRIACAAVLLMSYHLATRQRRPARRDLARLALYALFGVVLNQWFFVEGLARTTPSHSAVSKA